ncbi:hypothetical protein T09_8370 [Trichinella sp. T9]|nr:hypothetical protein T09_8370 [Trichinella sp. T9]
MRDFPGKQYTNLDATQVIRTGEHADGCRVDAHAFPSFSPVCQNISHYENLQQAGKSFFYLKT